MNECVLPTLHYHGVMDFCQAHIQVCPVPFMGINNVVGRCIAVCLLLIKRGRDARPIYTQIQVYNLHQMQSNRVRGDMQIHGFL